MRIRTILRNGGSAMLLATMLVATPVAVCSAGDDIRHVYVTKTGPSSLSALRLDPKSQAVRDKFLADTVKTRRTLAGKQAALQAVYSARTGNTTTAARLGEEIFDLREQLRIKAEATGISPALLMDLEDPGSSWKELHLK